MDSTPISDNKDQFHVFRENIATLNSELADSHVLARSALSKPAERILLKRVRQLGLNPDDLELTYIEGGGGLYLLELFVAAAHHQAWNNEPLLSALVEQAKILGEDVDTLARKVLSYPVLMVSLWPNQRDGLEAWLANDQAGILEMATATGKTVAGIAAMAYLCGDFPEFPDQRPETDDANIIVVAHSNAILKQWEREIREKLGLPMQGEGGGGAETIYFETGKVEFYTAQSLHPQYDRDLADSYDLAIYDEVHHYSNMDGFGAAIQRPNYKAAMGLSATIGDESGLKRRKLEENLAPVVFSYDLQDARDDGIIPDFTWTVHPTALDPYEKDEWDETTESISNQFQNLQNNLQTREILKDLSVPFVRMSDLGDFIQAHQAANIELDRNLPDSWTRLQGSIQSRAWIRHRSRPKLDSALELAAQYLEDEERGVKVVVFAMDIETTEEIADSLRSVTENVFLAHSELASSLTKKDEIVRQNIDGFASVDHGVLVSPRLLDEGIDVPDAEVGINVAGTKTKLQLVQRMGRVLRKHGDQKPHFHHFIALPDERYLDGIDAKEYVQEINWVRELGETIGQQPIIEDAHIDRDLIERAEQRGHELWARDLLNDLEVETVQGTVHLDQILEDLTIQAIDVMTENLDFESSELSKDEWEITIESIRRIGKMEVPALQRTWWLFPLYRKRPGELESLLGEVRSAKAALSDTDNSDDPLDPTVHRNQTPDGTTERTQELDFSTKPEGMGGNSLPKASEESSDKSEPDEGQSRLPTGPQQEIPHDLTPESLQRLKTVVELEPTKNAELMDKWNLESGSEVHQYLETHLGDYYFRDDRSLIRATEEAKRVVNQDI